MASPTETVTVAHEGTFRRELGLIDASAIVAGSMIGSGIFIVSADVARTVNSAGWLLLVWLLDAGLTLMGALAYGELAAMMPRAGGQYVYLREAYSPLLGFLYGWTLFLVIQSGTIAAVAVAFAKFLGVWVPWVSAQYTLAQVGPVSLSTQRLVAIAVIALLTWSNSRGVREGKIIQNLFTCAKVAALATLIILGLFFARKAEAVTANLQNLWGETPLSLGFLMLVGGAMVGPLFSSDAWNNVTFTAGEVKNPRRTLPLSLLGGTGVVMLLYCLTNVAYLCLLPLTGSATGETVMARGMQYAAEDRVATAAAYMIFGSSAASIMAGAIMVSTFGCLNGLILAGPRLYYAMARDRLFFARTGHLNEAGVPAGGLWLQMAWASLLTLSGTYGNLLDYVVFAALLFYMLTVVGLFILRRTRPDAERPYRVCGYPWLPACYVLASSALMLDLLFVKPTYTWPGLLIVLTGVPIYFLWQRRSA
ncbi:MAG TPA: amino acid permease [Candidatus Binatia bacterium]|jgi:APA family basic amino acid/polyamine antiporter|nr:amino acid permease [Candidatus Binatia bacterium]